jgi:hypothetical protein
MNDRLHATDLNRQVIPYVLHSAVLAHALQCTEARSRVKIILCQTQIQQTGADVSDGSTACSP